MKQLEHLSEEDQKKEENTVKAFEYYEKLGAILNILDSVPIQDADRAALTWAALDYHELLGRITGLTVRK